MFLALQVHVRQVYIPSEKIPVCLESNDDFAFYMFSILALFEHRFYSIELPCQPALFASARLYSSAQKSSAKCFSDRNFFSAESIWFKF